MRSLDKALSPEVHTSDVDNSINSMNETHQLTENREIINFLIENFPNCFFLKENTKPLKVGIFQDLVERLGIDKEGAPITKLKLRRALRSYTSQWRYLHSFVDNAHRIDLEGAPCAPLTQEEIDFAKQKLQESKSRFNSKKKSEKQKNVSAEKSEKANSAADKPNKKRAPKKVLQNPVRSSTVKADVKKSPAPQRKDVSITSLHSGDTVQLFLSSRPVQGTVVEVNKDNVKVRVESGMELMVDIKHISL